MYPRYCYSDSGISVHHRTLTAMHLVNTHGNSNIPCYTNFHRLNTNLLHTNTFNLTIGTNTAKKIVIKLII